MSHEGGVALVVTGVLLGAFLTNVAQFPSVESSPHRALARSDSADMADIGLAASPTVRQRRGVYLRLSQIAPGVDVIQGATSRLDAFQLYGLGRVNRVLAAADDIDELLADVDVTGFVVATDEDGDLGPRAFTIALADDTPQTLVVRRQNGRHDLIDVRLLPPALAAELQR